MAMKRAARIAKIAPVIITNFAVFPELPAEIRIMIGKHAFRNYLEALGRIIHIREIFEEEKEEEEEASSRYTSSHPVSYHGFGTICQEAQDILFDKDIGMLLFPIDSRHSKISVDKDKGVLMFRESISETQMEIFIG
jgi:hypothetical protein